MNAYRILDWESAPQWAETAVPEPGPGQVLVRVAGNGLCQSDLHMTHMPEAFCAPLGWQVPFTLGHEVGGWIEACGEGVDGWEYGEAVALVSPRSCGHCLECSNGYDNVCADGRVGRGYGRDGGLAEYVLVESTRPLVRLNDLDPYLAGPLTDAGATSYHAVQHVLPLLEKGTSVLVIGAGGLGSFAVQYLRLLSPADIIVADTSDVARERAARYGATTAFDSAALDLTDEMRRLTGGRGAQAVLDFVGNDDTVAGGLAALALRGSYVLVGAANGGHAAPLFPALASKAAQLYSFQAPTIADTRAVMQLAREGAIDNPIEWFEFSASGIATAYERLAAGVLQGRAVIRVGDSTR